MAAVPGVPGALPQTSLVPLGFPSPSLHDLSVPSPAASSPPPPGLLSLFAVFSQPFSTRQAPSQPLSTTAVPHPLRCLPLLCPTPGAVSPLPPRGTLPRSQSPSPPTPYPSAGPCPLHFRVSTTHAFAPVAGSLPEALSGPSGHLGPRPFTSLATKGSFLVASARGPHPQPLRLDTGCPEAPACGPHPCQAGYGFPLGVCPGFSILSRKYRSPTPSASVRDPCPSMAGNGFLAASL